MSAGAGEVTEKQPNVIVRCYRRVVGFFKAYFIMSGIIFTLGGALMIAALTGLMGSGIGGSDTVDEVAEGKDFILELKVSGLIRDQAPNSSEKFLAQLFGEDIGLYLPQLSYILRNAASDPRVKGLLIKLENSGGGLSNFIEFQELLMEFRKSEKPVKAYMSDSQTKDLLLASAATEVIMSEVSHLSAPGPVLQMTYFGKALEKLGISVEVIQSGKYKSAFEPFIQNEPSEASLEALEAVEEDLRKSLAKTIAAGRNKKVEDALSWMRKGMFTSEDAVFLGIADRVGYYSDVKETFIKDVGAYEKTVSFKEYRAFVNSKFSDSDLPDKGIALIEAVGEIHLYNPNKDPQIVDPKRLEKELKWAAEKEDVGAILIRVNSPGGSATASDIIWNAVEKAKSKKPVIISMGSSAASGGYYISAPASYIFAGPATITGSIGVIGMVGNLEPFEEKYGVSFHTISGSERKDLLDPGTPISDADKELLTASFKSTYQTFIKKVGKGRSKTPEEIDQIGQGRIWTGVQALENGLVDEIGGFSQAIRKTKELAGLDPDKPAKLLFWKPEHKSFSECFRETGDLLDCMELAGVKSTFQNKLTTYAFSGYLGKTLEADQSIDKWLHGLGNTAAYSPVKIRL